MVAGWTPEAEAPNPLRSAAWNPRVHSERRIPTRFTNPYTSGLWVTIKWEPRRIICYDIALRD